MSTYFLYLQPICLPLNTSVCEILQTVRQIVCLVLNTAVAGYWNYNIATIAYWKLCEEGWSEISARARLLPIPISRDREQN